MIWSNVVNNYLLGQKPPAFDLLYSEQRRHPHGAGGARLVSAQHLRREQPGPTRQGRCPSLDLGRIRQDIYAVGAEKDHIVPWDAALGITQLTGGKVRFVLASSGHIAGIINPPGGKGTYWTNKDGHADTPERWRAAAQRHDGELVDGTGSPGSPHTRARRSSRRPWVARHTRPCRMHPGVTYWRSSPHRRLATGRENQAAGVAKRVLSRSWVLLVNKHAALSARMSIFQCLRTLVAEPNPLEDRQFLTNVTMPSGALLHRRVRRLCTPCAY